MRRAQLASLSSFVERCTVVGGWRAPVFARSGRTVTSAAFNGHPSFHAEHLISSTELMTMRHKSSRQTSNPAKNILYMNCTAAVTLRLIAQVEGHFRTFVMYLVTMTNETLPLCELHSLERVGCVERRSWFRSSRAGIRNFCR